MNLELWELALGRIAELTAVAMAAHCDLERWAEPPLTAKERNEIGLRLTRAVEEHHKWVEALRKEVVDEIVGE